MTRLCWCGTITRNIAPLRNKLGSADRTKLEGYLTDIRELERRLALAEKAANDAPNGEVPFGVPTSYDEHVKLMFTMIRIAFNADITRVATLMLGRDSTSRTFPESGAQGPWHGSSHHGDDPANVKNYSIMNRYHVGLFAQFATQLKETSEADQNLLYHSLIYMGSNMGNSHRHEHSNVPVILAGRVSGRLETGRYLEFPATKERTSNLLLSILDKFGIYRESLGDSHGHLTI